MKPKKKNSKAAAGAPGTVKQVATFGKKKVKVGRILKRSNVTDSRVTTKKVVLLEQLKGDGSSQVVSHRGLSLQELCGQLGHYSETVRRDAIIGVKQLLENNPEETPKNLRTIIPAVGFLISGGVDMHSATRSQLKALIKLIFGVSSDVISSYFTLLSTHVLKGLTDIRLDIRFFAFDILLLLMRFYPDLCAQKLDLFDSYLLLMGSQRRPTKIFDVCKSISMFLTVFGCRRKTSLWEEQNVKLCVGNGSCSSIRPILPTRDALYFPVIYSSFEQQSKESPLVTAQGLMKTSQVLCPLIAALVSEQQDGKDANFVTSEMNVAVKKLGDAYARVKEGNCPSQLIEEIEKAFKSFNKCSSVKLRI